jgi:hypothetical protein
VVRLYDYFLIASDSPLVEDRAAYESHLSRSDAVERERIAALDVAYLGGAEEIAARSAGFPINRDRRPVCECYLGLRLRERLSAAAPVTGRAAGPPSR